MYHIFSLGPLFFVFFQPYFHFYFFLTGNVKNLVHNQACPPLFFQTEFYITEKRDTTLIVGDPLSRAKRPDPWGPPVDKNDDISCDKAPGLQLTAGTGHTQASSLPYHHLVRVFGIFFYYEIVSSLFQSM